MAQIVANYSDFGQIYKELPHVIERIQTIYEDVIKLIYKIKLKTQFIFYPQQHGKIQLAATNTHQGKFKIGLEATGHFAIAI